MHPNPRRVIPVIILVALAALAYWFFNGRASAQTDELKASGTIESTEYIIAPESAGRIVEVAAAEGDAVAAGQVLVKLDPSGGPTRPGRGRSGSRHRQLQLVERRAGC